MKLGIKRKRRIVLLTLMLVMVLLAKSQPNMAFYPIDNQFNSSDYNPAFLTSGEKFTFSIFPMNGVSVGYNNQAVINNLVSKFLKGITSDNDYKEVISNLAGQSSFHQNIEISLLSFTYRSNAGFFNFRIKECESFSTSLEGELTKFIFNPAIESAIVNQIQEFPAQVIHYREYSLGYSYNSPMNRFSAGIRTKLYLGKAAFLSGISGSIQNESDKYFLRTWGKVNMSFPEGKVLNPDGASNYPGLGQSKITNYLLNTGNPGFGVDLGIKYRVTSDLTFSLSAIDLGKINWKTNLNSKNFAGEYQFPASTINSTNGGEDQIINKTSGNFSFSDSISNLFHLTYDRSAFSNPLPLSIYAGLKYRINPTFSISVTDRYMKLKKLGYNSLSASANFDVDKKFSISAGYSIIGNSYANIPIAILFRRNFGQIYIGTENLVSILVPSSAEYAGISFGACFYLFTKRDFFKLASDDFPFYKPRRIKKDPQNGKIIAAN